MEEDGEINFEDEEGTLESGEDIKRDHRVNLVEEITECIWLKRDSCSHFLKFAIILDLVLL